MTPTHGKQEITDPVEEMLKKTGCINHHYKVQECIAETQDWRKCKEQVTDFKKCMSEYEQKKKYDGVKMVIVVRSDLNMGKGKIAAQAAHAAVSLYQNSSEKVLKNWLLNGQPKIVLKADSYEALMEVYESAVSQNLNCCKIRDAGRTQVEAGSVTAVGLGPDKNNIIDKITNNLKLL